MTSSTLFAISAILCGVALLYLVIQRTRKKNDEN